MSVKCARTNSHNDHMLYELEKRNQLQVVSFLFVWRACHSHDRLTITTITLQHVKTRPPHTSPQCIKMRPPQPPAHTAHHWQMFSYIGMFFFSSFFFFHSFTNVYIVHTTVLPPMATMKKQWQWQLPPPPPPY